MTKLEDNLVLLITTAVLSGLLVPFILNRVQVRSQRRQKQFEAELARQAKVIEEQVTLIERLSTVLWDFQLTLIAPLYYGQRSFPETQTSEPGAYEEAAKKYLSEASGLLGSIRTEIGRAVRLVPRDQWLKLRNLYYDELLKLDLEVTHLILSGPVNADPASWHQTQNYAVNTLAEIVDAAVDELAETLQLKYLGPIGPEDDRRSKVGHVPSDVMMPQGQSPDHQR